MITVISVTPALTFNGRNDSVLVKIRQEEGVDQSGFAQSRLTRHHQRKFKTLFDRLPVNLIRQTGESDILAVHFFF